MKITFSELTIVEAQKLLAYATAVEVGLTSEPGPTPIAEEANYNQPQKPRRRRRTKEQMAEARNNAARTAEEELATMNEPDYVAPEEEEKSRRRRRTRAQETGEAEADEQVRGPARRRRRRSAPDDDPTTALPAEHRRRKKGTDMGTAPTAKSGSGDDEITDRDVAKAASEGAQELTPVVVRGILDQFGESNVADLDQGQRREFIDLIDDAIEQGVVDNSGKELPND